MNRNLAKYRRFLNISQTTMSKIAGCCLTSYNSKEQGNREFTQKEMANIFYFIKKEVPDITVEELFFSNKVSNLLTEKKGE